MLNQASTTFGIWGLIVNPQAGAMLPKLERSPNTLIGFGCGHIPMEVQNHHLTVLIYSADKVYLPSGQGKSIAWVNLSR